MTRRRKIWQLPKNGFARIRRREEAAVPPTYGAGCGLVISSSFLLQIKDVIQTFAYHVSGARIIVAVSAGEVRYKHCVSTYRDSEAKTLALLKERSFLHT